MQTSMLRPALSPAVSLAIHQLRVPLILAVLMLLTLPLLRFEQAPLWLMLEQTLRVARPLFFFCAAYLLFRHWQSGWPAYRQLVQHRFIRLGACALNPVKGSIKDAKIPLSVRVRWMSKPTKCPPLNEWLYFIHAHGGPLWPLFYLKAVVGRLLPRLWLLVNQHKA